MRLRQRCLDVKNLKKGLLLLALVGGIGNIQAQRLPKNQPNFDKKPIHFGFSIGINYFDFNIEEIADLANLPEYYSVSSNVSPSYTIRIISNLRLADYLDLRFNPGFAATERSLTFDLVEPISQVRQKVTRKIESSYIELPVELKWKSERIRNYRLYVTGGGKYNIDLASKEDVQDDRIFKLAKRDFAYEFGFGVDIYFEYFKFSPQIIASWGVSDLMVQDGTFYVEGIHRLQTRSILINFTFE